MSEVESLASLDPLLRVFFSFCLHLRWTVKVLAMLVPCGRELGEADGAPGDEVEVVAVGPADLGTVGEYQEEVTRFQWV